MGKRIRPAALGPTAIVLATGIVVAINFGAPGAAEAQWWNPFNRPAETAPTTSARPPVPPADIGVPPAPGAVTKQNVPAAGAPGYLSAVPPPVTSAAPPPVSAAPLDATVRMERIEAQMRTLTGQIEQLNYQLNQLRDELRGTQTAAGATPTAGQRAADAAPPAQRRAGPDPAPAGGDPIGATIQGTPPRSLGTLPAATSDGPINLAALAAGPPATAGTPPTAGAAAPQVAAIAPAVKTASPKNDYDTAYQHILAGEYAEAEKGLRAFLAAYPDDKLAADAEYWLGDSLFERALFRDAAEEFVNGYKAYPKSGKAPDTLLKLGLSLKGLGERDAACQTYAKLLKDYPTITNVMVQRVKQEQKSATC
jgi:tol-pal system protein YbgF